MRVDACVVILASSACCFAVVGVVVSQVVVGDWTMNMVAEDKRDFTLTVDDDSTSHGGFILLVEFTSSWDSKCETTTVEVTNPNGELVDCPKQCDSWTMATEWMHNHDPPLQRFCHLSPVEGAGGNQTVVTGEYRVVTSGPVWAYAAQEEPREDIGQGMLAARILGGFALGLIILAVCHCCCGKSEEKVEPVDTDPEDPRMGTARQTSSSGTSSPCAIGYVTQTEDGRNVLIVVRPRAGAASA